jgi:hypothetical protein
MKLLPDANIALRNRVFMEALYRLSWLADKTGIPSLTQMQVLERPAVNGLTAGPGGTGKPHVALGLGLAASAIVCPPPAFWR